MAHEEPEEMRATIMRLKKKMQDLQQENTKVHTRLLHAQEQTKKRERQIEELLSARAQGGGDGSAQFKTLRAATSFTNNLKAEVYYLKNALVEKEREVSALKNMLKQRMGSAGGGGGY
jgi:septal ring factor EnvC (AmiA/AmiB activator)